MRVYITEKRYTISDLLLADTISDFDNAMERCFQTDLSIALSKLKSIGDRSIGRLRFSSAVEVFAETPRLWSIG